MYIYMYICSYKINEMFKIQNIVLIDLWKIIHLQIWIQTEFQPLSSFCWQDQSFRFCKTFLER